jgi:hypothetical protein
MISVAAPFFIECACGAPFPKSLRKERCATGAPYAGVS